MNIAVVGLGSMGKRRIRLIKQYCNQNDINDISLFGIDTNIQRQKETISKYDLMGGVALCLR